MKALLSEFQGFYKNYCKTDKLSYGIVGFDDDNFVESRGTGMPLCEDGQAEFPIIPLKYVMYHIRYRNGPGASEIENTQPIVNDRFVFMHNGRIKCLDAEAEGSDSSVRNARAHASVSDRNARVHASVTDSSVRDARAHVSVSDSRVFFNRIVSLFDMQRKGGATLQGAVDAALATLKKPYHINLIMMDRWTGEIVTYHHGRVPALVWDKKNGIIKNF